MPKKHPSFHFYFFHEFEELAELEEQEKEVVTTVDVTAAIVPARVVYLRQTDVPAVSDNLLSGHNADN